MAPSQSVVVVGQMAVWVVPHKPGGVGHLLMETNETETRMRNDIKEEEGKAQDNEKNNKETNERSWENAKIKKLAFMLVL